MDEPPSSTLVLDILSAPDFAHQFVVAVIAVLFFALALISASEAAFFSLQSKDLERLRRGDSRREQTLISMLNDPHLLWITFFIMNILVKVGIVTICTLSWNSSNKEWPLKIVILITAIVFIFLGELIPKIFGTRHNIGFAKSIAQFWKPILTLCKPISIPITKVTTYWTMNLMGKRTAVDGLSLALELAAGIEGASEGEKDILKGIANFGTLTVGQVMRTRTEISAISVKSNFVDLVDYINTSAFSRIPVYDSSIDSIIGVLYIKDLLPFLEDQEGFEWQSLLRPGFFVHEAKKIDLLLKDFQEKRVHMAIVLGEYGGTMGLVTLEDLIEEIIGEINDELDEVEDLFKKIDNNTYIFDGKTLLHDFCKTLDINPKTFQKVKGRSKSVAGLVLELNKKIPRIGDQIIHEQLTFVIESVDRRGIKRVRVKVHAQAK